MHKTIINTIEACIKCRGTGFIKVANERENHQEDIEQCPSCAGKRSVIKVVITEYFVLSEGLIKSLNLIPYS